MTPRRNLLVVLAVATANAALAQSTPPSAPPDAPPVDAAAILKEVDAIATRQADDRRQRFSSAIAALNAAARTNDTAVKAFLSAIESTQFAASGEGRRFREWRERHKDAADSKSFGTAARLHVRYLAISLQRAADPKAPLPLAELQDYVMSLIAAHREFGEELTGSEFGRQLLQAPILASPIVQANLIGPELQKLREWEMSAGNVEGILDRNLRGPLRATKDPRLFDVWTVQIQFLRDAVAKSENPLRITNFEQIDLPRLQWAQAEDMILIGQKNRGITEMVRLIKTYPNHSDFGRWVEEVREQLASDGGKTSDS